MVRIDTNLTNVNKAMETQLIQNNGFPCLGPFQVKDLPRGNADNFKAFLEASQTTGRVMTAELPLKPTSVGYQENSIVLSTFFLDQPPSPPLRKELTAVYAQQAVSGKPPTPLTDWQKYKDDQLLRNPGGDHYSLDKNGVSEDPDDRKSFLERVGKNLSDVAGNVKNFFGNLFMGSKFRYRDENGAIKDATTRGFIGTCIDFSRDLGCALSFGLLRPENEKEPQSFMERLAYSGSKLKQAILGDLMEGIPQSVNHMAKNVVLAGWNLVQVIPDATIGNFDAGRKLTTTIFDNGQVMVEYLTDVIPTGDAWFRVHAASFMDLKTPIVFNLEKPEHSASDTRWQYVRNTPFRKTIETIGALLADIASIGLIGQTCVSTNQSSSNNQLS